jgi:hypothetical protein
MMEKTRAENSISFCSIDVNHNICRSRKSTNPRFFSVHPKNLYFYFFWLDSGRISHKKLSQIQSFEKPPMKNL